MDINNDLKSFFRKERTIIIAFCVLFVIVSVTAVLYINGERKRNRLLTEYYVERTASALFESYNGGFSIQDETTENLVGFGVYNNAGSAVLTMGNTPSFISPGAKDRSTSDYILDRASSTMSMIRPIGMMPPFGGGIGGMMSRRPSGMAFLFIRVRVDRFWLQQSLLTAAYAVAPLLLAMVLFFIGRLYFRNWSYRTKIESQKNLVYLGEASRTLSHEIRNPLSAIQIQSGILRRLLPDERMENIDVIEEEVTRLRNLADRIRDFVKNPMGEPTHIDIVELIEELVSRYSWNVHIESGADGYVVYFDRERLRSVLENLFRNAVEASENEAPITVQIERQRSKLKVSILDRGSGLPAEHRDQLFDPFLTMKDSGSGIGLAISRRFVEAASGELSLHPRKGGGTEVVMLLSTGIRGTSG